MTCKNCDAISAEGAFCPNCGQKKDIHRITLGHLVHEFTHAITHADKGFLLLVKDLLRRPGYVAKEYLEGKRKKYFNPISFLVITAAVNAVVTHQLGYYEALSGTRETRQNINPYFSEGMTISAEHPKLLGIILILPLYTFLSWMLFRKPRYNFAEHFVLQSYACGVQYIFMVMVVMPIFVLFPTTVSSGNTAAHVIYLIYLVIFYKQVFQKNIFIVALKAILMMLLFLILFWVILIGYVMAKHAILG